MLLGSLLWVEDIVLDIQHVGFIRNRIGRSYPFKASEFKPKSSPRRASFPPPKLSNSAESLIYDRPPAILTRSATVVAFIFRIK